MCSLHKAADRNDSCEVTRMNKKDLRHMSRRELVDIVYEMTEQETVPEQIAPEEVAAERDRLTYRQRFRQVLGSTISALVVVAAAAVLLSTLFLPVIQVSGDSMEPAMHDGDILLLMKSLLRQKLKKRKRLLIMKSPPNPATLLKTTSPVLPMSLR